MLCPTPRAGRPPPSPKGTSDARRRPAWTVQRCDSAVRTTPTWHPRPPRRQHAAPSARPTAPPAGSTPHGPARPVRRSPRTARASSACPFGRTLDITRPPAATNVATSVICPLVVFIGQADRAPRQPAHCEHRAHRTERSAGQHHRPPTTRGGAGEPGGEDRRDTGERQGRARRADDRGRHGRAGLDGRCGRVQRALTQMEQIGAPDRVTVRRHRGPVHRVRTRLLQRSHGRPNGRPRRRRHDVGHLAARGIQHPHAVARHLDRFVELQHQLRRWRLD